MENIIDIFKMVLIGSTVLIILTLIVLLIQVILYIGDKRVQIDFKDALELSNRDAVFVSLNDELINTTQLLTFINTLVEVEINKKLFQYQQLGVKYELKNLDTDIKEISENVMRGFKDGILNSDESVLSSEYLMMHIINETSLRFTKSVKEMNIQISTIA